MEINISEHMYYLTRGNGKHKTYSSTFCYHRKTSVNAYKLIGNFPLTLILKFKKKMRQNQIDYLLIPVLHMSIFTIYTIPISKTKLNLKSESTISQIIY